MPRAPVAASQYAPRSSCQPLFQPQLLYKKILAVRAAKDRWRSSSPRSFVRQIIPVEISPVCARYNPPLRLIVDSACNPGLGCVE